MRKPDKFEIYVTNNGVIVKKVLVANDVTRRILKMLMDGDSE